MTQTFINVLDEGSSVDIRDLEDLLEQDPVKQLFHLVLEQSVRDRASDIYLGIEGENELTLKYKVNGVIQDLVPPPLFLYRDLGERIGLTFGLIEEKPVRQGIFERLRGKQQKERVLSPNAISNLNPKVKYLVEGEEVKLKLVRGDYNDNVAYHIQLSYPESKIN